MFLGVGVDRMDYTKGISNDSAALRGSSGEIARTTAEKFTFVQIGAPSRTHIKRYQDFAQRGARRGGAHQRTLPAGQWKPIVLRNKHHSHTRDRALLQALPTCAW